MEKHFHAVYSSIIPRLCTTSLRSQEVMSALPNRLPQGSRIHSLSLMKCARVSCIRHAPAKGPSSLVLTRHTLTFYCNGFYLHQESQKRSLTLKNNPYDPTK